MCKLMSWSATPAAVLALLVSGSVPLGVNQQTLGKAFTGAVSTCHHIPGLVMLSYSGNKVLMHCGLPVVALHQQEVVLTCRMRDLALL